MQLILIRNHKLPKQTDVNEKFGNDLEEAVAGKLNFFVDK